MHFAAPLPVAATLLGVLALYLPRTWLARALGGVAALLAVLFLVVLGVYWGAALATFVVAVSVALASALQPRLRAPVVALLALVTIVFAARPALFGARQPALADFPAREVPVAREPRRADFPKDFLFGAAIAAYQNEGDNKGSDFWDWEERHGLERSGKASDSYARFEEDLACLKDLGANAYRLNFEWGRIFPERGKPDEAVLARYADMLRQLRAAKITPVLTIHHFTNPRWFWTVHPDGWRDPTAADDYMDLVRLLAERFAGEVDTWITFNEPMVFLFNGYVTGHFLPGERHVLSSVEEPIGPARATIVAAHKRAAALLHELDKVDADGDGIAVRAGVAMNIAVVEPASDSERDRAAAERWDRFMHWDLLDALGETQDFVGINYYTRIYVRALPRVLPPLECFPMYADARLDPLGDFIFRAAGGRIGPGATDDVGRELYPEGIRLITKRAAERYKRPILITESGLPDGRDAVRASYIRAHLGELANAIDQGVPVFGYLFWTLVDNYEWGTFSHLIGLYRVDFAGDYKRTPTRGSAAYKAILNSK